jgi:signal transduction histidine kinase
MAMTPADLKKLTDKLAHDLRGPMHTAKLNLEAAEILAQKNGGPQQERLLKHLALIAGELEKLQDRVEDFAAQLQ